jgi:hypothetical protein
VKAILITLAVGILAASIQQYRIVLLQNELVTCNASVQAQNNATTALATAGQLDSTQSAERVATALLQAEREAKALPKGTGPDVMNKFMQAVFE